MSWGTCYKYHGYLIRITKNELDEKIEERTENIERIFREILAYMAMKPPVYAKDCENEKYPWAEHIAMQIKQYKDELEENIALRTHLYDCKETMQEYPEDVTND